MQPHDLSWPSAHYRKGVGVQGDIQSKDFQSEKRRDVEMAGVGEQARSCLIHTLLP